MLAQYLPELELRKELAGERWAAFNPSSEPPLTAITCALQCYKAGGRWALWPQGRCCVPRAFIWTVVARNQEDSMCFALSVSYYKNSAVFPAHPLCPHIHAHSPGAAGIIRLAPLRTWHVNINPMIRNFLSHQSLHTFTQSLLVGATAHAP